MPWARSAGTHPAPPGIRRLRGDVRINGSTAHEGRVILPGDVVRTGPDSEVVYVMGTDAFLVRETSEVHHLSDGAKSVMRILTGKVLSVFGPGRRELQTATATVGIRGTACYIESEPERVYFCLCYGAAQLTPLADPGQARNVQTRYHDDPHYITGQAAPGAALIASAPVLNHTDAELIMLESLVGRRPPFVTPDYQPRY